MPSPTRCGPRPTPRRSDSRPRNLKRRRFPDAIFRIYPRICVTVGLGGRCPVIRCGSGVAFSVFPVPAASPAAPSRPGAHRYAAVGVPTAHLLDRVARLPAGGCRAARTPRFPGHYGRIEEQSLGASRCNALSGFGPPPDIGLELLERGLAGVSRCGRDASLWAETRGPAGKLTKRSVSRTRYPHRWQTRGHPPFIPRRPTGSRVVPEVPFQVSDNTQQARASCVIECDLTML